jgi:IS1 family transposase/transposase-like protein
LVVKPTKNPDWDFDFPGGARQLGFRPIARDNPIVARAAVKGDSQMVVSSCKHECTKKHGRDHLGNQRFRCLLCGKTLIDRSKRPLGDLRIERDRAIMVLRMMFEGCSIRTIHRLTGVDRDTIGALLLLLGERCERFWRAKMRNIQTNDIQCDELWSFVGCKEKYRQAMKRGEEMGDSYTFLAIDRDTKLILTYQIGKRDSSNTRIFCSKLRETITGKCQVTTDGFAPYTQSVPVALWDMDISFAQLIKIFGKQQAREEARYSPAPITGIIKKAIWGNPDKKRVSTSHIERWNRSLRMGLRRFTRLTDAHSKSFRFHQAAITLWLVWYNFGRSHMTLKTTPAVKAGLTDEVWAVERLLNELATF